MKIQTLLKRVIYIPQATTVKYIVLEVYKCALLLGVGGSATILIFSRKV